MTEWLVAGTLLVLALVVGAAFVGWLEARKESERSKTRVDRLRLVQSSDPVLPAPKARYTGAPRHNRIS